MRNYEPVEVNQQDVEEKAKKIVEFFKKHGFSYCKCPGIYGNSESVKTIRINEFAEINCYDMYSIQTVHNGHTSDWWLPEGGQPTLDICGSEQMSSFPLDKITKIEIGHTEYYIDGNKEFSVQFMVVEDSIEL